jgi:hypothetical protein
MAHSYLVFDFGSNEDAVQLARHRIEGWKQGFRLGKKMLLKFDREELGESAEGVEKDAPQQDAGKKDAERIRLLVRLDFSDHEKLTHQRWLDRIPGEEPFKSASGEVIRQGDADFEKTAERFEGLS